MFKNPVSKTIGTWLKANCGRDCLAPLTGQDTRALAAAVQVADLWIHSDYEGQANAARAFAACVQSMQPKCQWMAFHAIAHPGDWSHRVELWDAAGLQLPARIPHAKHSPEARAAEAAARRLRAVPAVCSVRRGVATEEFGAMLPMQPQGTAPLPRIPPVPPALHSVPLNDNGEHSNQLTLPTVEDE